MSKRMHYDHARKAGNRGDVWKHFTIVTVIDGLEVPEQFRYVDLHSGAPLHELQPRGEWKNGIGRVLTECGALKHLRTSRSLQLLSLNASIQPPGGLP